MRVCVCGACAFLVSIVRVGVGLRGSLKRTSIQSLGLPFGACPQAKTSSAHVSGSSSLEPKTRCARKQVLGLTICGGNVEFAELGSKDIHLEGSSWVPHWKLRLWAALDPLYISGSNCPKTTDMILGLTCPGGLEQVPVSLQNCAPQPSSPQR